MVFTCLQSFENTVGKGEIAHNEQFLLFPQCFVPILITFCHFHSIKNCRLQILSVWEGLKFVVWERVKSGLCGTGKGLCQNRIIYFPLKNLSGNYTQTYSEEWPSTPSSFPKKEKKISE